MPYRSQSFSLYLLFHSRMDFEDDTIEKLNKDSVPDIFNTASFLHLPNRRTPERYQFLVDAAKTGNDRCRILAAKYLLEFFDLFPDKQVEAARVAIFLMGIPDENLRLTLLKDLHVVGTNNEVNRKTIIDLYLQCTMSPIEEERYAAYDGLVQFLHTHWLDVAGALRDLLNKEHRWNNRKLALEFLNDRMRIIPFDMYKNKEVLEMLETIFKEEFARTNLSYVDSLFVFLGNSFLMDNFEKQQSISSQLIDTYKVPIQVPAYDKEDPAITNPRLTSTNQQLDSILVQLTILHQMTTIMRAKSDTVNEWFNFVVDNIHDIFELPFDREIRALRSLAQFTICCTNAISDIHVDDLIKVIMDLTPRGIEGEADTSFTLPKIELHRLEPCCLALYNLRHIPSVGAILDDDKNYVIIEFKKRMRFLVRYCQLKSTEYKRTVEELGDIPMRKEMNALVAAATSVGLFAIEIVKPSCTWELKPRPSWKSCWTSKTVPRKPRKIMRQTSITSH